MCFTELEGSRLSKFFSFTSDRVYRLDAYLLLCECTQLSHIQPAWQALGHYKLLKRGLLQTPHS